MARKASRELTEAEARVMRVLWQLRSATVREVRDQLPGPLLPAYTTVLTMLTILQRKGVVNCCQIDGKNVYQPLVSADQARRQALRALAERLFDGSMQQVAAFSGKLTSGDGSQV